MTLKYLPAHINCFFLLLNINFSNVAYKKYTTTKTRQEVISSNWKAGDVFYNKEQWTECAVGNMPLIISVPHGRQLTPKNIPNRSCERSTTVTDLYTIELAGEISKSFHEKYNVKPYLAATTG